MTDVYILWHVGPDFEEHGDENDAKLLGVFSSEEIARAWENDARELPGFRDGPDRFVLDRFTLDERQWTTGFERVA